MFTGIVETVAKSKLIEPNKLEISTDLKVSLGESIAVNGVCLTVASLTQDGFTADLSEETSRRTNLCSEVRELVHLERAMRVDSRLGGHVVQGHVDATGVVRNRDINNPAELWIEAPKSVMKYLVEKGSIAVDGVSLTVAALESDAFMVALIPHTLEFTNLGSVSKGDKVNLEIDIFAKYVERLMQRGPPEGRD